MSHFRSRVSAALVVALTAFTGACQAWHVEKRPPEAVVRHNSSGPVAVTMNDLRWVVLQSPRVQSDSIIGVRTGGNTFGEGRTALSLGGVRAMETRRFSFLRTFYLGVAAAFIPTVYRFAVVDNE